MKDYFKYHLKIEHPSKPGEELDTWGIYPVKGNCAILDGLYNPLTRSLQLLFVSQQENYRMVPKVKDNGEYDKDNNGKFKMQRSKLLENYRGTISEEDIPVFLELYVDNNFEYVFSEPEVSKIITTAEADV